MKDHVAEVEFVYRLTGTGWSEARLTIGAASTPLTASYLDDALGEVVVAALLLPESESALRISWAEEPGEYRWVLDPSGDRLSVRVLWFDALWGSDPDEAGRVLMEATCSVVGFRRAIAAGARAVLDEWGEAGYREKWVDHDFPTAELLELERALAG